MTISVHDIWSVEAEANGFIGDLTFRELKALRPNWSDEDIREYCKPEEGEKAEAFQQYLEDTTHPDRRG